MTERPGPSEEPHSTPPEGHPPAAPSRPNPSRRLLMVTLGILLGLAAGTLLHLLRRGSGETEAPPGTAADATAGAPDPGGLDPEAPAAADRVEGRVVVPDGYAGEVRVELFDAQGFPLGEVRVRDGGFRAVLPAGTVGVVAAAPGLPAVAAPLPPPADRGILVEVAIRLDPGIPLEIRVADDRGEPVPGALVTPDPADPSLSDAFRRARVRGDAVLTDETGAARLTVAPGVFEIVVEAAGHVPVRTDATAVPGAGDPVRVEATRGGRLRGRVLRGDGNAAGGATVRLVGSGLWPAREFPADAAGAFDPGPIVPGYYEVEAFLGGDVSELRAGVAVHPGETTEVDLAVAPGGFVEGRVSFEPGLDGSPADLGVTVLGTRTRLVPLRGRTAADGVFRVGPLRPGRYRVRCAAPSVLAAEAWVDVEAGRDAVAALVLRRGRELAGTVLAPDGAPLADVRLTLSGAADDGTFVLRSSVTEALAVLDRGGTAPVGRLLPIGELGVMEGPLPPIPPVPFGWLAGEGEGGATPSGTTASSPARGGMATDAAGRFSCDALPPGRYELVAVHPDYAPRLERVVVSADGPRTTVVVRLEVGCALTGVVEGEDGAPLKGAAVWVAAPAAGLAPRVWRTEDDGRFESRNLPPAVTVRAEARGYLGVRQDETLGGAPCAAEIRLILSRGGGLVRGRVIDVRRFPVPEATVRIEPIDARARWTGEGTVSRADGAFSLAAPASGRVRVVASHPDFVETSLEASAGEDVDLVLARGGRIRGTVVDENLEPLAAEVTVQHEGRTAAAARTGADGVFVAGPLATGTYDVRAAADGYAQSQTLVGIDVRTPAGEPAETSVQIVLRRGVALDGRVVDRFGDPIPGVPVEAELAGARVPPWTARSGEDGRFRIPGLRSGRYRVTARHAELGTASADAALDVGTVTPPVTLAFRSGRPADAATAPADAGRPRYSVINERVIVSAPAVYHPAGTDPLVAGDVIVRVEREPIRSVESLRETLGRSRRPTVSVAVDRGGRRSYLDVDREAMTAEGW